MKNIKETKNFSAFMLTNCEFDQNIRTLSSQLAAVEDKNSEEAVRLKAEIVSAMTPDQKKQLANFGATLPYDGVSITLDLGSFLLDMYKNSCKVVNSPLGQLVHQKRLGELADTFSQEEFEIPESAIETIRVSLFDEQSWSKCSITANAQVVNGDTTKSVYFQINSQGAAFFKEILKEASLAVYNNDLVV